MGKKRVRHSAELKAKVALEALKGVKTVNELAGQYQVHLTQISQWKRQVQLGAREFFGTARTKGDQEHEKVQVKLYEEVGRLKMELDWMKKLPGSVEDKRQWIVPGHPKLSIRRQRALLNLGRAIWYYDPVEGSTDTLELMQHIDQQYIRTPFYGSRRMAVYLNGLGSAVNRKRVQRLMRVMGLEGVVPGSHTSFPHPTHPIISSCVRDPSAKEGTMFILTRKKDEAIRLGEDIRIVLVQIKGGQVLLGIECPSTIRVLREELYEAVRKENLNALSSDPSKLKALPKRQIRPPKTP